MGALIKFMVEHLKYFCREEDNGDEKIQIDMNLTATLNCLNGAKKTIVEWTSVSSVEFLRKFFQCIISI